MVLAPLATGAEAADRNKQQARMATREELRACMTSEDHLNARRQVLEHNAEVNRKAVLDLQVKAKAIVELQARLDEADQQKVDAFNLKVAEHNKLVESTNRQGEDMVAMQDRFHADVLTHNTACGTMIYSIRDKEAVVRERRSPTAAK